jgi:Phage integrase family
VTAVVLYFRTPGVGHHGIAGLELGAVSTGRCSTGTPRNGGAGGPAAVAGRLRAPGTDRELTVRSSATYVTGSGIVETTTKTNRTRHVPVPEPVWELLQGELPSDPNALVFPSHRGGHLPIEEYRRAFDKACQTVGIADLVPQGLRHTTASLAISVGANVKVVQRLLGHATAAITLDRYGHLLSDDLASVADALSKAIGATAVSLRYPDDNILTREDKSAAS